MDFSNCWAVSCEYIMVRCSLPIFRKKFFIKGAYEFQKLRVVQQACHLEPTQMDKNVVDPMVHTVDFAVEDLLVAKLLFLVENEESIVYYLLFHIQVKSRGLFEAVYFLLDVETGVCIDFEQPEFHFAVNQHIEPKNVEAPGLRVGLLKVDFHRSKNKRMQIDHCLPCYFLNLSPHLPRISRT